MAEAGSFAERVKQQADIVRVVGEYVRLKKSGQNFTGLCPFHSEKTPSFAVHPVKQIYHCFGCGVGGDVFSFVREMEKCEFPEAVRVVAEKCGIPIPRPRERSPEERRENQQRAALVEMHREAGVFYEAARRHAGGQGRARLFGRSGARRGSNRAVRTGLCAFRRRNPLPSSETEISGQADRSFRTGVARPERGRKIL